MSPSAFGVSSEASCGYAPSLHVVPPRRLDALFTLLFTLNPGTGPNLFNVLTVFVCSTTLGRQEAGASARRALRQAASRCPFSACRTLNVARFKLFFHCQQHEWAAAFKLM